MVETGSHDPNLNHIGMALLAIRDDNKLKNSKRRVNLDKNFKRKGHTLII